MTNLDLSIIVPAYNVEKYIEECIESVLKQEFKNYAKEKKYSYLDIDGVKVLFDDSWALVRASNTGPNITARFEAKTEDRLEEIKDEFVSYIDKCITEMK